MSIASRITEIEQHLTDDYGVLTLAGADLTGVNKNIQNLKPTWKERLLYFMNNGTDVVWNKWSKVQGTGETLTLNNTVEAPMKINLKGNTYQYTTTGKNKFDNTTTSFTNPEYVSIQTTKDTITITTLSTQTNNNLFFMTKIPDEYLQNGETYTISGQNVSVPNSPLKIQLRNKNGSSASKPFVNSVVYDNTYSLYVVGNPFASSDVSIPSGSVCTLKNIMVEKSSTPTTYEPFTGNQPSPSPSYPQDIQVVSGDNSIKVEGKNLCDNNFVQGNINNNTATNRIVTNNNLYLKSGTYTFSTNLDLSSYKYAVVATSVPRPTANTNILYDSGWKTDTFTFNLETDAYVYIIIAYTNQWSSEALPPSIMNGKYFQIEYGTTATSYTPYVSQTYPISLGAINYWTLNSSYTNSSSSAVWVLSDTALVIPKGTYTIACDYVGEGTLRFNWKYGDNTESYVRMTTNATVEFTQDVAKVAIQLSKNTSISNLQITKGNQPSKISDTPIELCKIGTYQDYIYKTDKWYLHKEIGKVVLDGSEDWIKYGSYGTPTFYLYHVDNIFNGYTDNDNNFGYGLTNNFQWVYGYSADKITYPYIRFKNKDGSKLYIGYPNDLSLNDFKTWLSNNNQNVYYVLATPTNTEITDTTLLSQLDSLEGANSYDNQTNVSQVNNDKPFILDLVALEKM